MSFLRWFAREGFRTLEHVFRGIFRSLLRYVPCTMHPPLFSHPLRVNGMAGVSLAPMPPGIALKTAAARYAPLRLHLADRAGLDIPVSTDPLTTVLAVSPGCAPAFPPVHLSRRKQSRAEPHVNGIFHRTHAPKYENYFRANHRLPASPWSTINKKKLATLSGQHDVRRRVFCLQDRT
jgi:hypothetical protein